VDTIQAVTLGSSIATALATAALFYVTLILARETKNLANATERPLVTANIVLSSQANGFLELEIINSGNSTAFDVEISISPRLTSLGEPFEPFRNVPIINPSTRLSVFLVDSRNLIDEKFKIEVSWKKSLNSNERQTLEFYIDLSIYKAIPYNAMINPVVKIANEISEIRKEVKSFIFKEEFSPMYGKRAANRRTTERRIRKKSSDLDQGDQ
jgi:hypothetical protein